MSIIIGGIDTRYVPQLSYDESIIGVRFSCNWPCNEEGQYDQK